MTKATGLKASTLFRAYDIAFFNYFSLMALGIEDKGYKAFRQYAYIKFKLTQKLEAQEKELEELRYTNGQLEIEISILNSVVK